jgi:hypothetical protein
MGHQHNWDTMMMELVRDRLLTPLAPEREVVDEVGVTES